nr:MAG TPA: hypothetical protein [Caudoviricetes sp.]
MFLNKHFFLHLFPIATFFLRYFHLLDVRCHQKRTLI